MMGTTDGAAARSGNGERSVPMRQRRSWRQVLPTLALALLASVNLKAQGRATVMNIVLVHGAWADGSSWQGVHDVLRTRGYQVSVVQNPMTSLADDVAAVHRVLARLDGPALLVGHSYGGAVITQAGNAANVAGLVYVSAFVPDVGESVAKLSEGDAPPPLQPSADGFLFFDPKIFPQAFAQDLPASQSAFLATAQVPPAGAAFASPISEAAWKTHQTWYVMSTEDRIIPPAAQDRMARRANATITKVSGSHVAYISQPRAVADAIIAAARAASSQAAPDKEEHALHR